MLIQAEADRLITLPKRRSNDKRIDFPVARSSIVVELESVDGREEFLLDVNRKGRTIRVAKCTYQTRYMVTVVLVRLDLDGPPHRNPPGPAPLPHLTAFEAIELPCPHLHVYVEDHDVHWAMPAPIHAFSLTGDLHDTLQDFYRYCNVIDPPYIDKRLIT